MRPAPASTPDPDAHGAARGWGRVVVIVGVAAVLAPSLAESQPQVRVRAEARLELHEDAQGERVTLGGTLQDDLGTPLARRFVTVRLVADGAETHEHRQEVRTDARGSFRATFPRPHGDHRAIVSFEGDATHDGTRLEHPLDAARADVRLRIHVPEGGRLDLARPAHEVLVWATSRAGVEALAITLHDERDQVLGQATTDRSGRALVRVSSDAFEAPGPGRLHARSDGDEDRKAASAEVPILRQRRPTITLDAPHLDPSGELILAGALADATGPLPERAVGLFTEGGQHLSTSLTDPGGRFEYRLDPTALEGGTPVVRARFDGDGSGHTTAHSAPVTLPAPDPPATPWIWLLAPMLATALLLTWMRLARRPIQDPGRAPAGERPPLGVSPGASAARSRERWDLAGRVIDAVHGRPVSSATATATLVDGDPPRALPVDDQGCFHAADLPQGELHLRVEAPGYAPVEARLRVPHRGEWSRAVVRMESHRVRALGVFRRAAVRWLPALHWPTRTNREVQAQAQARGAGPQFDQLTDRVERLYYGAAHPTGDDVDEVEATADAALAEGQTDHAGPPNPEIDGRGSGSL